MLTIAIISYLEGNPLRLTATYDPDCNIIFFKIPKEKACGLDYPDYPYLYFPILSEGYFNHTVCVKECPKLESINKKIQLDCQTNSLIRSC